MKTNHSKISSLLFKTDDTKKCLWHFSSPSFMRDYKDICSAGYAVVLFFEYAFQNTKIPGIPSGQKMIFRGWPESHFLLTAPTRCSIVLSSQQAKKQFIVSTIRKPRLLRYCQNIPKIAVSDGKSKSSCHYQVIIPIFISQGFLDLILFRFQFHQTLCNRFWNVRWQICHRNCHFYMKKAAMIF